MHVFLARYVYASKHSVGGKGGGYLELVYPENCLFFSTVLCDSYSEGFLVGMCVLLDTRVPYLVVMLKGRYSGTRVVPRVGTRVPPENPVGTRVRPRYPGIPRR